MSHQSPSSRPAARSAGPPTSRSSVTGTVILLALITSVLTTLATSYVLARYGPALVPPKTLVLGKTTVAKPNAANPKPAAAVEFLAPPTEAANRALSLVQTVRAEGSGLVGPKNHPNFWSDLQKIENSATAVAKDDGSNKAATTKLAAKFSSDLDVAIRMATDISTRTTETAEAVNVSAQINAVLTEIRDSLR